MVEPRYKNYRVCYDNGNAKTGKKLYELYKYCNCLGCQSRLKFKKEPCNKVTVTISDISKVDEIAEFLKSWTCEDATRQLDIVYITF